MNQPDKPLFSCLIRVPRHSSKKNEKTHGVRNGKIFIRKTEAAAHVESVLLCELRRTKYANRIFEPLTKDLHAKFTFYFPKTVYFTKKGQRSKKIPDLSNLYMLPEDCLQKVGIIENDTLIESHDGSRRESIEGREYFLRIELYEYSDKSS